MMMMKKLIVCMAIIAGVWGCLFLALNSIDVIPVGMTGAKETFGVVDSKPRKGWVLKEPFISRIIKVNTRQQTYNFETSFKTNDGQNVKVPVSIVYQFREQNVPDMVKNINVATYQDLILAPYLTNALQDAIGKSDPFLLVTNTDMVSSATRYILENQLNQNQYIQIKDILFGKPIFPKSLEDAIEKKLTETQLVELAKIQTLRVQEEAKQMLAMASANAKGVAELSKALSNPLVVKYEAIKALQKWDGKLPNSLVISDDALPIISPAALQEKAETVTKTEKTK